MADGRDRKNAKKWVPKRIQDWRDTQAALKSAQNALAPALPNNVGEYGDGRLMPRQRPTTTYLPNGTQFTGNPRLAPRIRPSFLDNPEFKNEDEKRNLIQAADEARRANGWTSINRQSTRPDGTVISTLIGEQPTITQQMLDNYRSGRYVYSGTEMYNPTREGLAGGPDTVVPPSDGKGSSIFSRGRYFGEEHVKNPFKGYRRGAKKLKKLF